MEHRLHQRKGNGVWRVVSDVCLLAVFCFFVSIALVRYAVFFENGELSLPIFVTGNEQSHFELVRAVVEGQTFAIDEFHHHTNNDIALYREHLYTNKPPGFAFLTVPVYALFLHKLLPLLPAKPIPSFLPFVSAAFNGAAVGLVYLLALDLGTSRRAAAFCALVAGLGTIMLVYAASFMNHVASVAFLLATLWAGFRYRATQKSRFLIAAAFCMSYSVLINHSAIVLLLPVIFYILWTLWQARHATQIGRPIGAAILAGALPLILLAYYNWRCFDSPFDTAYNHYQPPPSVQYEGPVEAYMGGAFLRGFWGFLFSWSRGMFVYTPILLCAIPGFYFQLKERRLVAETIVLATTASVNVLLFAPYRYWFGGHSIGPRHVLPAIALVAILMAPCLERLPRWGKWGARILSLFSIIVHVMLTFLSYNNRALAQSWLEHEGNRLGNLYTEILPLITTTQFNIWGSGLFQVMKLVLFVLIPAMAFGLGRRWEKEERNV